MNLQNIAKTLVAPIVSVTRNMENYFRRNIFKQTEQQRGLLPPKLTLYDQRNLIQMKQRLEARRTRLSYSQTSEKLVPEQYLGSQRE